MIYVTGDLHGVYDSRKLFSRTFNKDDIIIVCGDFGYVWYGDEEEAYELERLMQHIKCTLLFIDGNHENFDLLEKYPKELKFGGEVQKICENCYHLLRGERYNINGYSFLCVGGAESHDADKRVLGKDIWVQEHITYSDIDKALDNLSTCPDFIITHCAPTDFLTMLWLGGDLEGGFKVTQSVRLLQQVREKLKDFPISWKWFMGHYHIDVDYKPFYVLYKKFYCVERGSWV